MATMAQRLDEITYESFEALAGQPVTFLLDSGGGVIERYVFEVAEVQKNERVAAVMRAGEAGSLYRRVPFAVLFRAVDVPTFNQGLMRLEQDSFEECMLLVTRVMAPGHDPAQAWFEAIFG